MNQAHRRTPGAKELRIEIARIARFGIVGILAAIVYAVVTALIVQTGLGLPLVATVIGHLVAGTVSYLGHLYFSFAVVPDHRTFLYRFVLITAAALALNVGVTWLLTQRLGMSYWIAIGAVTVLIPAMNYLCNRLWVFQPGIKMASRDDRDRQ
jgi:putative flippase GtrA